MSEGVVLDAEAVRRTIPHRPPFLLVHRIVELTPGERIVGIHDVTADEPWVAGHFPGHPVMPGVLIVEALAQTAAVLMLYGAPAAGLPLFAGIDEARFRRPVTIGDELRLDLQVLRRRSTSCRLQGRAIVDGQVAAEAVLFAVLQTPP